MSLDRDAQPGGALIARQGWRDSMVDVGDVRLHFVETGDGPPIVLLHGFPEFWYSWRKQLPALSEAGFRAIAPDLRGYNLSDKPHGVQSYRVSALVADIAEFIRQLPGARAHVVGHDWGGAVAWRLAARHPELVNKLAVMNCAFPSAYSRELRRGLSQWLRSWYIMFFQLPKLPEFAIARNQLAALRKAWKAQPQNTGAFTDQEIAEYQRAFDKPSALTGPVNYYRAAVRRPSDLFGEPRQITAHTLLIWGEPDPFATPRVLDGLDQWIPHLRIERIAGASHWVQNDAPARVNALLASFLRPGGTLRR